MFLTNRKRRRKRRELRTLSVAGKSSSAESVQLHAGSNSKIIENYVKSIMEHYYDGTNCLASSHAWHSGIVSSLSVKMHGTNSVGYNIFITIYIPSENNV